MTYGSAAIVSGGLSKRFENKPWARRLMASILGAPDPHSHIRWTALSQLLRSSRIGGNAEVLEVGCGEGFMSFEIERQLKPSRVVGIEPESIPNAGVSRIPNGDFVDASATDMPFESESFDCAFMIDVLEHIPEDTRAVDELARVLRPGGTLFVSVPTPRYPQWFGRRFHESIGHVRDGYEPQRLRTLLESRGFEVADTKSHTGLLSLLVCAPYYRWGSASTVAATAAVLCARVTGKIEQVIPSPTWGGVALTAVKRSNGGVI